MRVQRKHFASIDSTNTWAKDHLSELPQDQITLVTADTQTAGRGRFKRSWLSPEGNVYATFCFFWKNQKLNPGNLPQILALAAAEILETHGLKPKLKWPNDLLVNKKKIGGILCETIPYEGLLFFALGIGLNVNLKKEEVESLSQPATSLSLETGNMHEREGLLSQLQEKFLNYYQIFRWKGFSPFLASYKNRLIHQKGETLKFHQGQDPWEGVFIEITNEGHLKIKLTNGEIKEIISGEITEGPGE